MSRVEILGFRNMFLIEFAIMELYLWSTKRDGDFTFLKIYHGKRAPQKDGRKSLWIIYMILVLVLIGFISFGVLAGLVNNLNPQVEIIKGKALTIEDAIKEHFDIYQGTIYIQNEAGKRIKVKHVYFKHKDVDSNQFIEILIPKSGTSAPLLRKSEGKYTEVYERYYRPPELVRSEMKKLLLVYILLGVPYLIWKIGKEWLELKREILRICYLECKKIKTCYVLFALSGVVYILELVMLLLNQYSDVDIMKICLCGTYCIYKLSYYVFFYSRYNFITVEEQIIVVKQNWREKRGYPIEDCILKSVTHGKYIKIKFPDRKNGFIAVKNEAAQQLIKYVN